MLSQYATVTGGTDLPSASSSSQLCFQNLQQSYEPRFGGFTQSPKFPQPVNMSFLLQAYVRNSFNDRDSQLALDMVLHTLKKMAKGGIHDHIGLVNIQFIHNFTICLSASTLYSCSKGFARYSTDEKWHVPHFEKMLYDQAQIAALYCDVYLITKKEEFAVIVRDILSYSTNCLSDISGGFYRYFRFLFWNWLNSDTSLKLN